MLVFVINKHGEPLMPCSPRKARILLFKRQAKVIHRTPFTIKLLYGSSGYRQEVVAGMDTGSKVIGCAAIANGEVVYQSEVAIRQDVSKNMQQRAMYRRTRRSRKLRYRASRWLNRANSKRENRLAPSLLSKVQSHLRERDFVQSILPVSKWKVELASFDIHKISNPDVVDYQKGKQLGYENVKQYVLNRDGYTCQSGRKIKHDDKLHVHHIVFRSQGGTNTPDNLVTLCEKCHKDLHAGKFAIKGKKSKTKHATEVGIVKSQLKKLWNFEETFGYETKRKRQNIGLSKTHYNDAVAICCEHYEMVKPSNTIYYKKHVSKGDYQQTSGIRSEKTIPTGKLFELRKFDLIQTPKGTGFIKGKRSSGFFALMDIHGGKITDSVNVKKDCIRLSARTTTLIKRSVNFSQTYSNLKHVEVWVSLTNE